MAAWASGLRSRSILNILDEFQKTSKRSSDDNNNSEDVLLIFLKVNRCKQTLLNSDIHKTPLGAEPWRSRPESHLLLHSR